MIFILYLQRGHIGPARRPQHTFKDYVYDNYADYDKYKKKVLYIWSSKLYANNQLSWAELNLEGLS